MTVATFTQPDYPTQTDSTDYASSIDASIRVMSRIGGPFAAHEQSTPDMTVRVDAGAVLSGTTLTEVAAQSTGTITAPVSDPRIDRIVIDQSTGVASVVTGSEAASPSAPAVPSGKFPCAQVLLATSTTEITNSLITDERVGFHGSVSGDLPGQITFSGKTDVTLSAQSDDYNIGDVSHLRVNLTGDQTLTGIANGVEGRIVTITSIDTTDVLTIAHESTSSTAANRIWCPGSTDLVLPVRGGVTLRYEAGNSRWIMVGTASGGGSAVTVGTPLVLNPYAVATVQAQAHGLGAEPDFIETVLECVTAEQDYSIGDRVDVSASYTGMGTSAYGFIFVKDSTNVTVITHISSLPRLLNKTTGNDFAITAANWKIIATPYLYS